MNIARHLDTNLLEIKSATPKKKNANMAWLASLPVQLNRSRLVKIPHQTAFLIVLTF